MKANIFIKVLFAFLILVSFNGYSQDTSESRPAKEKWNKVKAKGTITDINKDSREVTVMGSNGSLLTITADDSVKRFEEFEVNDIIAFEYYTYMKAEFRQPTKEELQEPLVVVAEGAKAPDSMDPAAVVGAVVKAVVTVEVINRPEMIVTVKGPRGNYVSIAAEDEALIKELHVGEVVILTYAEALAISLEKVK